jgi:hypothetical protein
MRSMNYLCIIVIISKKDKGLKIVGKGLKIVRYQNFPMSHNQTQKRK